MEQSELLHFVVGAGGRNAGGHRHLAPHPRQTGRAPNLMPAAFVRIEPGDPFQGLAVSASGCMPPRSSTSSRVDWNGSCGASVHVGITHSCRR